jgi:hypothetical protein
MKLQILTIAVFFSLVLAVIVNARPSSEEIQDLDELLLEKYNLYADKPSMDSFDREEDAPLAIGKRFLSGRKRGSLVGHKQRLSQNEKIRRILIG